MDLPRLLFVNEAFYPHEGGAERRSFETLYRLQKKGFEVKILTNSFSDGLKEPSEFDVDHIATMKESEYFNHGSRKIGGVLKFTSKVRDKLKHYNDYDIYSFDEFPILHAVRGYSSIRKNATKFFTWHEVLKDFYLQKGGVWRVAASWERKVSNLQFHNIAVSDAIYRLLLKTYSKHNVSVIENGVNVSEFSSSEDKEWGKILYVGRVEPHKQLDSLVAAVSKDPKLKLDIVGAGSQLSNLKSISNGNSSIRVLGHVPKEELIDRMKRAWLFVMPSSREGFSIASLEAMAASVPVITKRSQFNFAADEIIRDGKNGLIVNDFSQMIDEINSLYGDENRWKELSMNAKEFAKSYDWNVIADKLARLYISAWS